IDIHRSGISCDRNRRFAGRNAAATGAWYVCGLSPISSSFTRQKRHYVGNSARCEVVVDSPVGSPGYEVTAVRYGTRWTTRSDVSLPWGVYGEADEPTQMDYFFWVARSTECTILIDCGFNDASGGLRR